MRALAAGVLRRIGLAPRIAIVVLLTMAATSVLEKSLSSVVPFRDFVFFDKAWLIDAAVDAVKAASGPQREDGLSASTAARWLDLRLVEKPDDISPGRPLPLVDEIERELAVRLGDEARDVIVTAAPIVHPERAVRPITIVIERLPALMRALKEIRSDSKSVLVASDFRIAIALRDGRWLLVTQKDGEFIGVLRVLNFLSLFGGLAVIGALSVFTARRLTRPLTRLAEAAERLGREREVTPIPQLGMVEYDAIATSFNEMQARLKRFVDDRTRLLGAISHDLRTPLTRIRLLAEFVPDVQRRQLLSDIAEMETMIETSLAFASEEARREPHGIVDIAAMLISLCDSVADAGGNAQYHGPDHAPLSCQPVAMRRAFANLIDNGCKYGEAVSVTLRDGPRATVVTLRDIGPGIPPHQVAKAFAPFQRLEDSRSRETGGTGLGLTIARDVILGHGGEIRLAPAEPSGLLVTVVLPKPASLKHPAT